MAVLTTPFVFAARNLRTTAAPPETGEFPLFILYDTVKCAPASFLLLQVPQNAASYQWKLDGSLVSTLSNYFPFFQEGNTLGQHQVELTITTSPNQLLLNEFVLLSAVNWGLEFHPDPYFEIKNNTGQVVYQSQGLIDGDPVVAIPGNTLLENGQHYTLEVYDWDPFDPDDLMGSVEFTAGAGSQDFEQNGLHVTFNLQDAADSYTWKRNIYLNEATLSRTDDGSMVVNTLYPFSNSASFYWSFNGTMIPNAPQSNVLPASFIVEEGVYSVQVSDNNCFAVESLSGNHETLIEDLVIQAWPNPSNGSFWVSLAPFAGQKVLLRVSDSAGRVVWEQQEVTTEVQAIDLADLPAGTYYLLASDGERMAVQALQVW